VQPVGAHPTGGHVQDLTQAAALAAKVEPQALLGDKGNDADGCIEPRSAQATARAAKRLIFRPPFWRRQRLNLQHTTRRYQKNMAGIIRHVPKAEFEVQKPNYLK
jgi:hypothetical protein